VIRLYNLVGKLLFTHQSTVVITEAGRIEGRDNGKSIKTFVTRLETCLIHAEGKKTIQINGKLHGMARPNISFICETHSYWLAASIMNTCVK
jgi:hypothetical protein